MNNKIVRSALPFIADGLALIFILISFDSLSHRLQTVSGVHALWLGVVYILFWVGVYGLRKLTTETAVSLSIPEWFMDKRVRTVLAVLFGLALMTALSFQFGYFDSIINPELAQIGEGEAAAFYVFGPGAWLGVSLFYILVLAFDVRETIATIGSGYNGWALFGLLAVNAMLFFIAAQTAAIMTLLTWPPIARGVLLLIGLPLLFLPPRLIFYRKQGQTTGLVSFGAVILVLIGVAGFS